jgi:DNA-binding beta-propeller fold protein YncE
LDLAGGQVVRRISLAKPESEIAPGSHPTSLLLSPDEKTLYVTLSNADRVVGVSTADGKPTSWFSTWLNGQAYGGTSPVALALSQNGKQLLVATAMLNGVAVFNLEDKAGTLDDSSKALAGFIPPRIGTRRRWRCTATICGLRPPKDTARVRTMDRM